MKTERLLSLTGDWKSYLNESQATTEFIKISVAYRNKNTCDIMNLLFVSIFLLITAVAIGLYLVFLGLHKRKSSTGLGLTHASFALAGIIVLFTQIVTGPTDKLNNVAALFLFFAIVGGGMVFALREENKHPFDGCCNHPCRHGSGRNIRANNQPVLRSIGPDSIDLLVKGSGVLTI